jgi:hypothetical protein
LKHPQERVSNNQEMRTERTNQPASVQNDEPGYGDKKLEGPNRPST